MFKSHAHRTMDMTEGSLLTKVLFFSLPIMLSGILQLLFNAADTIVVGRFAGNEALAAVGSVGALNNMIISLFVGLSIGVNVLVARFTGAKDTERVCETVHTAVLLSLVGGAALAVVGFAAARPLLEIMGSPEDVIDLAELYIRIIFIGMPVQMLYNFCAAVLRAVGDTKRPLYFLTIAGVINAGLNLVFVIGFKMSVAGVALATVISQCISAFLVIRCLMHSEGAMKLSLSRLGVNRRKLLLIIKVGLPAGIQGAIFAISNVLIQSSVNSFGSIAMAGNTASQNIEGFVYTSMNALYQTNLSFTSQNIGAEKYTRIKKILATCQGVVVTVGLVLGFAAYLGGPWLLQVYSEDADVISYGLLRMSIICTTYFLCGVMDTMVGSIRGLGYSILPTLVSLTGACGLRVIWIFTIFAAQRSLAILYLSYPISWAVTATAHMICFWRAAKKLPKEDGHPVRG